MLSIEHLAKCLKHVKLDGLANELGVTRFMLVKIKSGDNTAQYKTLKKVSDYFESVNDE